MILINLLPHREERRKRRKTAFMVFSALSAFFAGLIVLAWFLALQQVLAGQQGRNQFLQSKIQDLEVQIQDVSTLRSQIDALKARQKAVEDLQVGRNLPVNVLAELVKQTPEGVYIVSLNQEGQSLSVSGLALSNERVSDFLRNTNDSDWFTKPELISIEVAKNNSTASTSTLGQTRLLDFSMRIGVKSAAEGKAGPSSPAPSSPGVAEPKV